MNRFFLIPLLSFIQIMPVYAGQLDDFCSRRSVGTVAELRHEHYPQLSQREIEIARKAAVLACIDSRTASFSNDDSEVEADVAVAEGEQGDRDAPGNDQLDNDEKSWAEKFLGKEKTEDLTPMMKQHRTGGK